MRRLTTLRSQNNTSDREGLYVGTTNKGKKIFTYSKSKEKAFLSLLNSVGSNETISSISLDNSMVETCN